MKLNKIKILFWTVLLISEPGYSQEKKPAALVPSANAMNLGVFGEIPVSLFSGLPEINVPVYTINANKISVPINLMYHASGVRPDVHPSWVGLGWSLSAGGSINRIIKGYADEMNSANHDVKGYYYTHASNTRTDWPDVCPACNTSFENYLKTYSLATLQTDYSPDEFQFSFPGHNGKFFLDDQGNWKVQCDKPVKVELSNGFITPFAKRLSYLTGYFDNASNTFKQFTITDEFGIKYIFGETVTTYGPGDFETTIEYSDVFVQSDGENSLNGTGFFATSWQLKKIVSPDGVDVVEFNYERGPFQSYLYSVISKANIQGASGSFFNPGCYSSTASFSYGGKITSPVYLKSIVCERQNLKIAFTTSSSGDLKYTHTDYENVVNDYFNTTYYEDNNLSPILDFTSANQIPYFTPPTGVPTERRDRFIWLKLDRIDISNSQTKTNIRSAALNYTNSSNERLRLGSIDFKDANNASIYSYSFGYNTQSLPAYMATKGDHWGFNNGSPALSNSDISNPSAFYSSRNPVLGEAAKGILEQVTYPTGGQTIFEYALHTYIKAVNKQDRTTFDNVSGTAGGLRVKKIRTLDKAGHEQIMEYFYVTGYNANTDPSTLPSSGILDAVPQYDFTAISATDMNNVGFTYGLFSSNPIIPLSQTTTGQHIGYSEVVEKRSDGAYTIYKYTNHDNGYADVNAVKKWNRDYVPYLPNSSRDFERGRLLTKLVFDNNNKAIQSEEYEYDRLGTNAARSIQQDYKTLCSENPTRGFVSRAAYYLYYYPFVVKKITTKNYQSGTGSNYVTTVKDFTYENKLTKTIITTDSKGLQLKTENFYPWNLTGVAVNNTMVTNNMLDYVIQTDQLRAGQLKKRNKVEYKQWINGGIYPEFIKEQVENNSLETQVQINDYDSKGNILYETSRDGIKESFLWSYNQLMLVAKVIKADASEIAYTSFEINYNSNWSIAGVPLADYNAPTGRKVYSLSIGNISKSGLNTGKTYTVSYWSKNGVQNVNGTTATAGSTINGYTYYEHNVVNPSTGTITVSGTGTIDELRLYPQGALMTSYTYEPLIGMSSQCDANNRISYYEYDAFGRLILIRDQDRNIIKKVCYNYTTQTENCTINYFYNNVPKSATFQKQCPIGYTAPASVTYTVPVNVYSSTISTEAANQLAQADVDAYAQAYVNATGICRQIVNVQPEIELTYFYEDEYTYFEEWDVWFRFYGLDPYTPIYLESDLNIRYKIVSYGGTEYFTITAPTDSFEYYLGNYEGIYIGPEWSNSLQFIVVEIWW